jgi:hypothetical protein
MQLESWISLLSVSLIILIAVIAYRKLLVYFSRNRIKTEDYCILYDLEIQNVSGTVEFYFTTPSKKNISFEILDSSWNLVVELVSKEFDEGGHIIRFDTGKFPSGQYFYGIKTEGQVLHKKFTIA